MTYLPPALRPREYKISDPVFITTYKGFKMNFVYSPSGSKWFAFKDQGNPDEPIGHGSTMEEAVQDYYWNIL